MKHILILGAGLSSKYLITTLLQQAEQNDWFVTVGDRDTQLARRVIDRHPSGSATHFDVDDAEMRSTQIENADIVVNMLPPTYQHIVAQDCIAHGRHMVSASYESKRIRDLDSDANRKGVLILTEMGLDPGIDHMIAMSMVQKVRKRGGRIKAFKSYGGALPAQSSADCNPLGYFITWNPRNVVMAGEHGAQYMEKGKIKLIPFHNVFQDTWLVDIDGIGSMEVYPNRETLAYKSNFDLNHAQTIIRGTIRYPGWSETWSQIVKLGMPNENLRIPRLSKMSYRDFTETFIPVEISGSDLESRVAKFLNINPTGKIMEQLRWLGLFSEETIGKVGETPAEVMVHLIKNKLKMEKGARDMVILYNEMDVSYTNDRTKREKVIMTLVDEGEPGGFTAIARTVGMPVAIATELLLKDKLPITGCQIPTHPAVYVPLLRELKKRGLSFKEKVVRQ